MSSPALAPAKPVAQPLGPSVTGYNSFSKICRKIWIQKFETQFCSHSTPSQEKMFVRPEAPAPKATPRTVGQVAGNPPSSTQPSPRPQPAPTSTPATVSATASTPAPASATLPNPVQVRFSFWLTFRHLLSPLMWTIAHRGKRGCGPTGFGCGLLSLSLSNISFFISLFCRI